MATRPTAYDHMHMSEFQPETKVLKPYVERTRIFFTANDIPEDKQTAVLLSIIGGNVAP